MKYGLPAVELHRPELQSHAFSLSNAAEAFLDCNIFEFSYICGKFLTILTHARKRR